MLRVNVHDAKTHLSRYLQAVENGEVVVLCRRNVPIAELRPIRQRPAHDRPIGMLAASFTVPDMFFEPLPEELVNAFEGR
jgi:prevent-host-death family protein